MNRKLIIPKAEREKYKLSILNHTSFEEYTADLSKHRINIVLSDLISYCFCFHSEIQDLMVDEEEAREKVNIFEKFLFDNDFALATVESRIKTVRSFYRFNGYDMPKKCDVINKTFLDEIKESETYNDFLSIKKLAESTQKRYLSDLSDYCHFNNMGIDELIAEADIEEEQKVRLSKRKIKTRLINFRRYLRDKGYAEKQIKTRFRNVKSYYRTLGYEIPDIPADTKQYDRQLRYDEVPTKEHIKRALEGSTNIRNKALYLFMATSGCASEETRTFTVREWMLGTKDFHGETTDIQKALDKMDGEMEYIPAFPIVREKKHLDFYTLITPEANQYIVNWLKSRENLTLDDTVFDLSENALGYAFASINDKFRWGKVKDGRHRFFSSHQMRRFHFNVFGIENKDFAHTIEGRKFSATEEAYFTRDPAKLKKQYGKEEFLNELTIFQKYKVKDISSKEYVEMQEKLQEKDKEIEDLKNQLEKQAEEHSSRIEEVENEIKNLQPLKHLDSTNPLDISFMNIKDGNISIVIAMFIGGSLKKADNLTQLDKKLRSFSSEEIEAIKEIAYDTAIEDDDYIGITYDIMPDTPISYEEIDEIKPIIQKTIVKINRNPQLLEDTVKFLNQRTLNSEKIRKYHKILRNELKSLGIFEENEIGNVADRIARNFENNVDKILLENISNEFVKADIDKFLKI